MEKIILKFGGFLHLLFEYQDIWVVVNPNLRYNLMKKERCEDLSLHLSIIKITYFWKKK